MIRLSRALAGSAVLVVTSIAACSGNARSGDVPHAVAPASARVSFSIAVPSREGTSSARRVPQYISTSTQSATFAVTGPGASATSTTISCPTQLQPQVCAGTIDAPIGSDTFAVTLYSGTNGDGSALSSGSVTQTIAAGTNDVHLTFDPIVAQARVVIDPSVAQPAYFYTDPGNACASATGSACGSKSIALDLVALDASGATIVGPGNYIDANGDPLTFSVTTSDANGTTFTGPTTFTSPGTGTPATTFALSSSALSGAALGAFDDPVVSLHVSGGSVANLSGIDVPVVPNDRGQTDTNWAAQNQRVVSLFGSDASFESTTTSTAGLSIGGKLIAPIDANAGYTTADFLTESSTFGEYAFAYESGSSSATDRLAAIPAGGCTTPDPSGSGTSCPGQSARQTVTEAVVGGNGAVWGLQPATFSVIEFAPQNSQVPTLTRIVTEETSASVLQALTTGNGQTMYTFLSDGPKVYLGSIVDQEYSVIGTFQLTGGVNVAGYSPADGFLYVVAASDSSILRIDPSNASATTVLDGSLNGHLGSTKAPMTILSDGSLAYVGSGSSVSSCHASIVHIVPGRLPNPVSILPALPSATSAFADKCTFESAVSSILPNGTVVTSDGSNEHAAVW